MHRSASSNTRLIDASQSKESFSRCPLLLTPLTCRDLRLLVRVRTPPHLQQHGHLVARGGVEVLEGGLGKGSERRAAQRLDEGGICQPPCACLRLALLAAAVRGRRGRVDGLELAPREEGGRDVV